MTDFRALCAELADRLQRSITSSKSDRFYGEDRDALARARAALAQPEPQGPKLVYRYCPVTIAECGGPCEQGPEYCDCGEIKGEPAPQPEPQGPPKNCWLDDEPDSCPSPCVFDDPSEVIDNCMFARKVKCKTDCKYYRAALAQPEPQGPTDAEIYKLALDGDFLADVGDGFSCMVQDEVEFARAVLARWGRPAIEPVPKQEAEP